MKHYQLILAVALVALTGCNKSNIETFNTASEDEIGFNAVARKATKANNAIVSGTTYDHANTFQVWGWQSEAADFSEFADDDASNFMSNITISWTKGSDNTRSEAWRNATHYYYWPFTGAISFLAIHPSTVAPTSTGWDATNKKPKAAITGYTITPGTNETVDLMFATKSDTRASVLAGDGKVGMVFKHALSQIEVQVKTDQDYTADVAFDVESVTFNNIDLSGDVAYANDAISWSANDTQTQNWIYYNTKLAGINNVYQVYGAAKVNIPQPANFDASALNPSDPQYDANDTDKTTITIGYSMTQTGSSKITGTVTIDDPFLSNSANKWESGKKYNYTINFRLNEILFNPSVTNWVDVNVETINIY